MALVGNAVQFINEVSTHYGLVACAGTAALGLLWFSPKAERPEIIKEGLLNISTYLIGRWVIKKLVRTHVGYSTFLDFFVEKIPTANFDLHMPLSRFLICLVAVDFLYYWRHRIEHRWPPLWVVHSVHHTARYMNWTTAFRNSWFIRVLSMWIFFPLLWLGFDGYMIMTAYMIKRNYQFLIHTEWCRNLGPLEWIFHCPSHHRVHHQYIEGVRTHNYSAIFILWDRLFGTYRAERERVPYAIDTMPNSNNPWVVNFHYFGVIKNRLKTMTFTEGFLYVFLGITSASPSRVASAESSPLQNPLDPVNS